MMSEATVDMGDRTYKTAISNGIRLLRKRDLEAECQKFNLNALGTRDELRRRVLEYARAHVEIYKPLLWVFQLNEEVLKEELEAVGQTTTGTHGDLLYRLLTYVREHGSEYVPEELSEQTLPIKVVVETLKGTPLDVVRRWNLKFGPSDSIFSFLERLKEYRTASNLSEAQMLLALPELLKGKTLLWYRNMRENWNTWEDFLIDFKSMYLPLNAEETLEDEIRARTQGSQESVAEYVNAVRTLIRRLTFPWSSLRQLQILLKNLRPDVKLYIRIDEILSIADLLKRGKEYDKLKKEEETYKPPPSPSEMMDKETAYIPKIKNPSNLNVVETQKPTKDKEKQIRENPNTINSRKSSPPVKNLKPRSTSTTFSQQCWNCNKVGHRFFECRSPLNMFCFRCGRKELRALNANVQLILRSYTYFLIRESSCLPTSRCPIYILAASVQRLLLVKI